MIKDSTELKWYPTILKYIAGHRGDGRPIVKVFLRDDNTEAKVAFLKACIVSKDVEFEVVAEKSNKIKQRAEEIRSYEKTLRPMDKLTRTKLKKVIHEYGEKIYALYSNVVGMGISKVRCVDNEIQEQPCIVLYCLDKTIIPFGEKPLPRSIAGCPFDIREDFVMFGTCPSNCPSINPGIPEIGCSIGRPSTDYSGSVGFIVESKDPRNSFSGFITASHVAVELFQRLYEDKSLLSWHYLSQNDHPIVHPSWQDNGHNDHTIGKVVESFCGNYGLHKIGLDFALVKTKEKRKDGIFCYILCIF